MPRDLTLLLKEYKKIQGREITTKALLLDKEMVFSLEVENKKNTMITQDQDHIQKITH